jgi:hypothetical protein
MSSNALMQNDPLFSRKEAARYLTELGLETAPQTLARKFHEGTGPLCTHVGDRAMYRRSHLDQYFAEQVSAPRRSSSEPRKPSKAPALVGAHDGS